MPSATMGAITILLLGQIVLSADATQIAAAIDHDPFLGHGRKVDVIVSDLESVTGLCQYRAQKSHIVDPQQFARLRHFTSAAPITILSLANNHALDAGEAGFATTCRQLQAMRNTCGRIVPVGQSGTYHLLRIASWDLAVIALSTHTPAPYAPSESTVINTMRSQAELRPWLDVARRLVEEGKPVLVVHHCHPRKRSTSAGGDEWYLHPTAVAKQFCRLGTVSAPVIYLGHGVFWTSNSSDAARTPSVWFSNPSVAVSNAGNFLFETKATAHLPLASLAQRRPGLHVLLTLTPGQGITDCQCTTNAFDDNRPR